MFVSDTEESLTKRQSTSLCKQQTAQVFVSNKQHKSLLQVCYHSAYRQITYCIIINTYKSHVCMLSLHIHTDHRCYYHAYIQITYFIIINTYESHVCMLSLYIHTDHRCCYYNCIQITCILLCIHTYRSHVCMLSLHIHADHRCYIQVTCMLSWYIHTDPRYICVQANLRLTHSKIWVCLDTPYGYTYAWHVFIHKPTVLW